MPAPLSISTGRPGVWLPPAFVFGLVLLLALGSPEVGSRMFYAVLTLASGYLLFRARRVGVEVTEYGLVIRGQFRTHRFSWTEVRGAALQPMRTASPLRRVVPYVALVIELVDGRSRQFEEVSAAASDRSKVKRVADAINAHLAG